MNPQRWRQVKELFEQIDDLDPSQREALLERTAGQDAELAAEVRGLLASSAAAPTRFERPAFAALSVAAPVVEDMVGRRLGPWRLERRIAVGGMGVVYEAHRADGHFDQAVAIKLIRRELVNPMLVRRFQIERQTLAHLDHPNIARLLDGGVTEDGAPYYVMDLVHGRPIDVACEFDDLSVRRRLELFLAVCSAVQYAHQCLVIHCDLKPSNVLVTDAGIVKLVDFGVAHVLRAGDSGAATQATVTSDRRMTPEYASPEQIRGEPVTTATDVYALGVVLYELLTGRRPYEFHTSVLYEIERIICEQEPKRPSTVRRTPLTPAAVAARDAHRLPAPAQRAWHVRISADLDAIVLRAMAKNARKRYSSVEQLQEDVRRHLTGRPVEARAPTPLYRLSKYVRRNWPLVTASAVALAVLVIGAAATAWQAQRARWQRDHAWAEEERSRRITRFLQDMLAKVDPHDDSPELTVREVLDRAAQRITGELAGDPRAQTELRWTIGSAYLSLGEFAKATEHLQTAKAGYAQLEGQLSLDYAQCIHSLAQLAYQRGQYAEGRALLEQALDIRRRLLPARHQSIALTLNDLGALCRGAGDPVAALEYQTQALAMRRELLGPRHPDVAESLNNLALLYANQGGVDRALEMLDEALEIRIAAFGRNHTLVAQLLDNRAVVHGNSGDMEAAEYAMRESLAAYRQLVPPGHPDLAFPLTNMGSFLIMTARPLEAEPLLREALEIRTASYGEDNPRTAQVRGVLGMCLLRQRRFAEAEAAMLNAYHALSRFPGERHPQTLRTLQALVDLYRAWDMPECAAEYEGKLAAASGGGG